MSQRQRPEHWAHLAAGALLALAGAAEVAAAARRGDAPRARAGAAAAAIGWLAIRYGALYARVRRVEIATGTWQLLTPDRPAPRPLADRAAPSPPPGPPWVRWSPYQVDWPPRPAG